MPRNKSEKHPFGHLPPKYVERLRLYALWKQAERIPRTFPNEEEAKANTLEAKRLYNEYRDAFTIEERRAYMSFQQGPGFTPLKQYWLNHYAP